MVASADGADLADCFTQRKSTRLRFHFVQRANVMVSQEDR